MNNILPSNWIWTTIGEIGEIVAGSTPSTLDETNFGGEIPWITPADLTNFKDKFIQRGNRNLTEKGLNSCSARLLPKGTVLFSSRAPIGYVVIAANPIATNQGFKNVILSKEIFNEYLYYYLLGNKELVEKHASGTTFLEVSAARFKQVPIALPPLGEQRRIVSRVEQLFTQLDEGVRFLHQVQIWLEQYEQATLQSAFEGYPQDLVVQDISNLIQYGTSEKASTEATGMPVLRMGNLQEMALDFSNLKYMPKDWDHPEITLNDGDVLFNRTNSAELVGKTAVYHSEHPKATFASYLIRVKVDKKKYLPDLLSYYINSSYGKIYIKSVVSQQVGQANVNGTKLANMPIPNIPLKEQQTIKESLDGKISIINDVKKDIEENLIKSNQLKQGVLRMAFEGKLVSQDPSDEPALLLLERIKAAKDSRRMAVRRRRRLD